MLKRYIGLNNLVLFFVSFLFQNPINAEIGDKYSCQDYANSVYESQNKVSRKNWKFTIEWNRENISVKFDNFEHVYKPKIVMQDANFVTALEYDSTDDSGMNLVILDETNENNILTVRTLIDSNDKIAASYFSKCKKI